MSDIKVFLSSTQRGLRECREAMKKAIDGLDGFTCVRMEDFGARQDTPAEFCRRKVAECDIFLGLLGPLYGSRPPDSDKSFTEIEYDAAGEAGIPRLVFLLPEDFPLPASDWEGGHHDRQKAFRERVRREQVVAEGTRPEDLWQKVVTGLVHLILPWPELADRPVSLLAQPLQAWLEAVGYKIEACRDVRAQRRFEWTVRVPRRRGSDRCLVWGVAGEGQARQVQELRRAVEQDGADEGWLVAMRRMVGRQFDAVSHGNLPAVPPPLIRSSRGHAWGKSFCAST